MMDILPLVRWWAKQRLVGIVLKSCGCGRKFVETGFHLNGYLACEAYRQFNADSPGFENNYDRQLIEQSVAFGYVGWPKKIQKYVKGRTVLDVGCGTGLHGIGYIIAGAKSYTGLDPKIDLDSDLGKNTRTGKIEHFGATPRDIMERMPRVRLIPGTFEDLAPNDRFDFVVLHNVTEHLHNIETVFEGIRDRLEFDGVLLYHHHSFQCWNGHHQPPRTIDQIDESDPAQMELIDWKHLTFEPPKGHYISRGLNKIRLDGLKALTQRLFDIDTWKETPATEETGFGRLTPEILAQHPEYTERELTVKNVLCVARHKSASQAPNTSKKKNIRA